jgi:precorrin-2 dehydrogenase/sirohydrochlorin ferrochelatase
VVGGGPVAGRKIRSLLECEAQVRVIAPDPSADIRAMAEAGTIELWRRAYQDSDLAGYFLVFAATNDEELNRAIFERCQQLDILVNSVDDPVNCGFFVPATMRRGALTISVSTEGKSPLLARRIREQLEEIYGPEYADYIDILGESRAAVKKVYGEEGVRRRVFERILQLDVMPMVRSGNLEEAKERIRQCIYSWPE